MPVDRRLFQGWNLFKSKEENINSSYNALKSVTTEHERIHAGKAWLNKDEYYIAPNTVSYYAFIVESYDTSVHVRNFGFVSDQGPMKLHFRESPSLNVNSLGVSLSLNNMNRTSGNLPGMRLYGGPVVDVNSLGQHLDFILQPESAPGNQPAGGSAENAVTEWLIDNDKSYLFSLQNTTANTATIESQFFAYRSD